MTTYIATVEHHSIYCHYQIEVEGSLTKAKRAATKEFGDGFLDHQISIYDKRHCDTPVASRKISSKRWSTYGR